MTQALRPQNRLRAVIDIGTNTIKVLLAQGNSHGKWTILSDTVYPARLGENLPDTGLLTVGAMTRTIEQLQAIFTKLNRDGCKEVIAVGTMALRSAHNANLFIEKVRDVCGIEIRVLTEEEESRLSYLAARRGFTYDDMRVGVFDIGGGSTEITIGSGDKIEWSKSFDLGALHLTELIFKHDPVTGAECEIIQAALNGGLSELSNASKVEKVVGIGGTIVNIASVALVLKKYERERIHGFVVTLEELRRQWKLLCSLSIAERKKVPGMDPARADVIVAGIAIVGAIMDKWGVTSVVTSDRGLRHALLYEATAD